MTTSKILNPTTKTLSLVIYIINIMVNRRVNSRNRRNRRRPQRFTPGSLTTITWSGNVAANSTIALNKYMGLDEHSVKVLKGQFTYNGDSGSKVQFALRGSLDVDFVPTKLNLVGPHPKVSYIKNPIGSDPWVSKSGGTEHIGWITNLGPGIVYYVANITISSRDIINVVTRREADKVLPTFSN